MLVFTGCSGPSTPESVVEKLYSELDGGDVNAAMELVSEKVNEVRRSRRGLS